MANSSNLGKEWPTTSVASVKPTLRDIAWAAGFYEGEGSCRQNNKGSTAATAGQINKEPLTRMLKLFGGSLKCYKNRGVNRIKAWHWGVYGARARGFLMTIYTFLSEKRKKQIRKALA